MSDWSHEWGDTPCGRCKGTRGLHEKTCPTQKKPSGNPQALTYKAPAAKTKYRQKPPVVTAVRYEADRGLEDAFGYKPGWGDYPFVMLFDGLARPVRPDPNRDGPLVPLIKTADGYMAISVGDWIVTGIDGQRRPVSPDLFAASYEPAE